MYQFIETIKIQNGIPQNLEYHQQRMVNTIKNFYSVKNFPNISETLRDIEFDSNKLFKCRILYTSQIDKVDFNEYNKKEIRSIKIIACDYINYDYKFSDRTLLNQLLTEARTDEIIIIKNGLVTDSSYSNLVFQKSNHLYTPANPLLKGTKRQQLIDKKIICEKIITEAEVETFEYFYLINSMLDLDDTNKFPISIIKL